jgi:hypothetical protein
MTIFKVNISTLDLLGLLGDIIPFAADPKVEEALAVVRLEWDGAGLLHAQATNRIASGNSTWCADDMPEMDVQLDMFTQPGGDDNAWVTFVPLHAAKTICADFKLPDKDAGQVMITMTYDIEKARLTVMREFVRNRPGKTTIIECFALVSDFPEVRRLLAEANEPVSAPEISYSPRMLSTFGNVRPRGGHMTLTFVHPRLTAVHIGPRFVGAITPVRERDPRDDVATAAVLAGPDVDDGPVSARPVDRWLTGGWGKQ